MGQHNLIETCSVITQILIYYTQVIQILIKKVISSVESVVITWPFNVSILCTTPKILACYKVQNLKAYHWSWAQTLLPLLLSETWFYWSFLRFPSSLGNRIPVRGSGMLRRHCIQHSSVLDCLWPIYDLNNEIIVHWLIHYIIH